MFLSFFRDDVGTIRRELRKRKNGDLFWGNIELAAFATTLFVMFLFNWRYVIFYFLPFFYLGHCFSYLNGYYRHYGGNPDKPIAWGVSSYNKLYNWTWTKMEKFHQTIADLQKQEGVRTIKRAHMLGFLDPDLPKRGERNARVEGAEKSGAENANSHHWVSLDRAHVSRAVSSYSQCRGHGKISCAWPARCRCSDRR